LLILIENDYEKVDILINCAGVMYYKYEKTVDKFETNLQINYLGHFLLTHLLVPMLKRSINGRIINVSGNAYSSAQMNIDDPLNISNLAPLYHPRDAFAHSKLAVLLSTRKLATELKTISVNCCTPGFVRGTKHGRDNPAMKAKLMLFLWMYIFMKSPVMGAQTIIYLATESNLKSSGKYYK
jgi:NAD(P)-dependent dehydrogenase (short-subunit alcohol dehydrogenase family)